MTIREHDLVVLTADIPEENLKQGDVGTVVLLHRAGMTIAEVPVLMRDRTGGRSSITPIRSAYYMVKVLLAVFIDLLKK